MFAHGSGSSRHSPRNRYVAGVLNAAGLGTLLFDLLTADEELDRANVFDIELLAGACSTSPAGCAPSPTCPHRIGYFGASTGAAAALWAAADPDADIAAVVSRGGRPDLAGPRLAARAAHRRCSSSAAHDERGARPQPPGAGPDCAARTDLDVVPGATHLFEEPGTLEAAAGLAGDWFTSHLAPAALPR